MKRIDWLDNCKAIGIFLVVLGHFSFLNPQLKIAIYAFHLPLFLAISGFLIKADYLQSLKATLITLKPYLITYAFFTFISLLLWGITTHPDWQEAIKVVVLNVYGTHGEDKSLTHANGALWYLPFLVASMLLYHFCSKLPKTVAIVLLLILTYFSQQLTIRLPWSFDAAPAGALFLLLGSAFKQLDISGKIENLKAPHKIFLIACFLSLSFYLAIGNLQVNINQLSFGRNVFIFYLSATCAICAVVLISTLIKSTRLTKLIGENTLLIFCLHLFFVKATRNLIAAFDEQYRQLIIVLLAILITLSLTYVSKFTMPYFKRFILRQ